MEIQIEVEKYNINDIFLQVSTTVLFRGPKYETPKCIVHMKQRNYVKLHPVHNLNIHIFTQCKLVNSDKPVLLSKPCVLWIGRVFANLAPHKSKLSAI